MDFSYGNYRYSLLHKFIEYGMPQRRKRKITSSGRTVEFTWLPRKKV